MITCCFALCSDIDTISLDPTVRLLHYGLECVIGAACYRQPFMCLGFLHYKYQCTVFLDYGIGLDRDSM